MRLLSFDYVCDSIKGMCSAMSGYITTMADSCAFLTNCWPIALWL